MVKPKISETKFVGYIGISKGDTKNFVQER